MTRDHRTHHPSKTETRTVSSCSRVLPWVATLVFGLTSVGGTTAFADDLGKLVGVRRGVLTLYDGGGDFVCDLDTSELANAKPVEIADGDRCPFSAEVLAAGLGDGGIRIRSKSSRGLLEIVLVGRSYFVELTQVKTVEAPRPVRCSQHARLSADEQGITVARGAGDDLCETGAPDAKNKDRQNEGGK